MPTAPEAMIAYGEPATTAVATAPVLLSLTLDTESLLTSPLVVKSGAPVNVSVCPYVLVRLSAVIVERAPVSPSNCHQHT